MLTEEERKEIEDRISILRHGVNEEIRELRDKLSRDELLVQVNKWCENTDMGVEILPAQVIQLKGECTFLQLRDLVDRLEIYTFG